MEIDTSMDDQKRQIIEVHLKKIATTLRITSVWLLQFNSKDNTSVAIAEYVGLQANLLEQESDLGKVYPEVDHAFIQWLQAGQQDGQTLHVDELDREDPDWLEYVENGVDSVGYMPVLIDTAVWGYLEFWESRGKRIFTPEDFASVRATAQAIAKLIKPEVTA